MFVGKAKKTVPVVVSVSVGKALKIEDFRFEILDLFRLSSSLESETATSQPTPFYHSAYFLSSAFSIK